MSRPVIDPELRALIPPLRPEERELLEQSIASEGCRDPLVVWAETGILLDGHHRLEICERLGVPYRTVAVSLPDRDAARLWMLECQLGRRNLTTGERIAFARQWQAVLESRQGQRTDIKSACDGGHKTSVRNLTEVGRHERPHRQAARLAGVSHDTYAKGVYILEHADEETRRAYLADEPLDGKARASTDYIYQTLKRKERERQRQERLEQDRRAVEMAPDPTSVRGRYRTIVLDPPWDWGDEGDCDQLGRARPTYATMPYDELVGLPVGELAADDAHVYLWITNRSLPKGFGLLEAWGFRYVTCLTWVKPTFGMGNYFRGQTEHVLFGVRGSLPLQRHDVGTVFHADRGPDGHSSKPDVFYELVESCSPGPYLEMFCRRRREGWVAWGSSV